MVKYHHLNCQISKSHNCHQWLISLPINLKENLLLNNKKSHKFLILSSKLIEFYKTKLILKLFIGQIKVMLSSLKISKNSKIKSYLNISNIKNSHLLLDN